MIHPEKLIIKSSKYNLNEKELYNENKININFLFCLSLSIIKEKNKNNNYIEINESSS